jgi:aspartyl-tRNA(Asn)/glutamyl-tRNA(Gln) amidotransferase subunit A
MIDTSLTIERAAANLSDGRYTARELAAAYFERIKKLESQLNVFIRLDEDLAFAQADASDARRAAGTSLGILDGIPYTLKDVYATKGSPTTAASHMLEGWTAPYDATVYRKLCAAGCVMLGKTNTDEFTMGVSTETSYFGVTRNPWDLDRVSGGSSGGPAAAQAARLGLFAIGTDTGGSIRQPASFCGVLGLRPTYGRISRFGEIAMASSLDQTGPLTSTARDAAIVLAALAGHDPLDATSAAEPVEDYLAACEEDIKGMKIGIPQEYFGEGIDPDVEATVRAAVARLTELGAETRSISLPSLRSALAAYYIIAPAEVSSNMARYDGIRFGYSVEREPTEKTTALYAVYAKSRAKGLGAEVKRRIMLGTHALSSGYYDAYYAKAEAVRAVVRSEFETALSDVDIIAGPVSPHVAFKVGEKIGDPLAMYKEDILTVPLNIAGVPGLSVPCGFVAGLPVGLQLIAGRFQEATLLRAAAAFQTVTDAHLNVPNLAV